MYGTKYQLAKLNISSISVGGCEVKCVDHVRDLGVYMDSTLNVDTHIRKKCQIAYAQLRNLKDIRKHLSQKSTEIMVHGLIHSHIDFCNGLFTDIPAYLVNKLQKVQNQAARVVTSAPYDHPTTEILKSLHWLPVRARIMFNLKCLFNRVQGKYRLRSSDDIQFTVPRTRTKIADRSIAVVGPKWWNALPKDLKCIKNEITFRKELKTYLFKLFYS